MGPWKAHMRGLVLFQVAALSPCRWPRLTLAATGGQLQEVAAQVGAPLQGVPSLEAWRAPGGGCASISLGGRHQLVNAGLAVQMCATFEREALAAKVAAPGAEARLALLQQQQLPQEYVQGLERTVWPGRSQVSEGPRMLAERSTQALPCMLHTARGTQSCYLSLASCTPCHCTPALLVCPSLAQAWVYPLALTDCGR